MFLFHFLIIRRMFLLVLEPSHYQMFYCFFTNVLSRCISSFSMRILTKFMVRILVNFLLVDFCVICVSISIHNSVQILPPFSISMYFLFQILFFIIEFFVQSHFSSLYIFRDFLLVLYLALSSTIFFLTCSSISLFHWYLVRFGDIFIPTVSFLGALCVLRYCTCK